MSASATAHSHSTRRNPIADTAGRCVPACRSRRLRLKAFPGLFAFVRSYGTPAGRRALRNLLGLVLIQVVSQACNFGLLLLLTHGLGPEQYGSVVFAQSVQAVLQTVVSSGFAILVVRDLSRKPEDADTTITAYVALAGAIAVVCGIGQCVWAFAAGIPAEERVLFLWFALANVFASLNLVPVYDAAHRQSFAGALLLPCEVLGLGITAALVATGTLTLPTLGVVLASRVACQSALLLAFLPRFGRRWQWRFESRTALDMLRAGWPVTLATVLYVVPTAASIAIVRFEHGPTAAAVYGLASQFAGYLFVVFSLAVRVLQPHIAGPYGLERSMLLKIAAFVGAFVVMVGAVAIGAGYLMFHRVLDGAYSDGFGLFLWLLLGSALVCGTSVVAHYQIALNREWALTACYFSAVVVFGLSLMVLGTATLERIAFAYVAFTVALLTATTTGCVLQRDRSRLEFGRGP